MKSTFVNYVQLFQRGNIVLFTLYTNCFFLLNQCHPVLVSWWCMHDWYFQHYSVRTAWNSLGLHASILDNCDGCSSMVCLKSHRPPSCQKRRSVSNIHVFLRKMYLQACNSKTISGILVLNKICLTSVGVIMLWNIGFVRSLSHSLYVCLVQTVF